MKLTKKELLYMEAATRSSAPDGIFDFENSISKSAFKKDYGLTMKEVDDVMWDLREKVLAELGKKQKQLQ